MTKYDENGYSKDYFKHQMVELVNLVVYENASDDLINQKIDQIADKIETYHTSEPGAY